MADDITPITPLDTSSAGTYRAVGKVNLDGTPGLTPLGPDDPTSYSSFGTIPVPQPGAAGGPDLSKPAGPPLSSADILAQGRNLALQGVPLAVGGVLESVNALQAKANGSAAEILPSVIENLGQLRGQYAGASQAIGRKLGYGGGGQTLRAQQANLAGATRQYAGLIQNAQQQGVAGLNQVEGGFAPLVSGVAREPSKSQSTSPFDTNAAAIGGLAASLPGVVKNIGSLFGSKTPDGLTPVGEPIDTGSLTYGPTTIDAGGATSIPTDTSVPIDIGGLNY
jgi:hypothetical protein